MKTKYWIALFAVLLALSLGAGFLLMTPGEEASFAQILSEGQLLHTVNLHMDQELTITTPDGGRNVVTVKDGKIAVTEANCPDHYCMARGFCSGGLQIVCLPNQLIVRFLEESAVDAVIG